MVKPIIKENFYKQIQALLQSRKPSDFIKEKPWT